MRGRCWHDCTCIAQAVPVGQMQVCGGWCMRGWHKRSLLFRCTQAVPAVQMQACGGGYCGCAMAFVMHMHVLHLSVTRMACLSASLNSVVTIELSTRARRTGSPFRARFSDRCGLHFVTMACFSEEETTCARRCRGWSVSLGQAVNSSRVQRNRHKLQSDVRPEHTKRRRSGFQISKESIGGISV